MNYQDIKETDLILDNHQRIGKVTKVGKSYVQYVIRGGEHEIRKSFDEVMRLGKNIVEIMLEIKEVNNLNV